MALAVEFLRPFRFAVRVDGKPVGIAFVGEVVIEQIRANLRPRPVTLVSSPKAGGVGLAALVYGARRHEVLLDEFAADAGAAADALVALRAAMVAADAALGRMG
jgi:hypothetical protein